MDSPNIQKHSGNKDEPGVNGNSISSKNVTTKEPIHDLKKSKDKGVFVKSCSETIVSFHTHLKSKSSNLASLVVNLGSFMLLVILFLLFKKDVITPVKRGFFCNDLTIRYPIGENTISTNTLIGSCLLIAILIFILGEYLFDFQECPKIKNLKKKINLLQTYLSPERWYIRTLKFFFIYSWSLLASQVLVNVLKCSVGSLRPHFFKVCNPNVACNDEESTVYHTEYVCQGITTEMESSLRTSFPSGHAAFSAAAALFLVYYIQRKMKRCITISFCGCSRRNSTFIVLLGPSLQFACLLLSCWTSILRVSDYKHHLMDVIVGYILGGGIGLMSAHHALNWDSINKYQNYSSKKEDKTGSAGLSIQELVELNEEERNQQNPSGFSKDEDIEKVMEHEGISNSANVNVLTVVKTESE